MWKSKSKKGYTLIEVVCALSVLSILLLAAMTTELCYFSAKEYNKTVINSTFFMETVKNNMLDKYTYDEINNLVSNRNYYILKENMNLNSLKQPMFISNLISQSAIVEASLEKPYMCITKESVNEGCIRIKLTVNIQKNSSNEALQMDFLKGSY